MNRKNKSQMRSQAATTPVTPLVTHTREFAPDYSYVKKDLTRIGVLAGFFITVLVVLSLFLR